jgi:hypothetical protein
MAPNPHTTVLEISDKGIKMIDKNKSKVTTTAINLQFYYFKNNFFYRRSYEGKKIGLMKKVFSSKLI